MKIRSFRKIPRTWMVCAISAIAASLVPVNDAVSAELAVSNSDVSGPGDTVSNSGTQKKDASSTDSASAIQSIEIRASKSFDARREDTVTKIVVPQAELVRYGDTTLADALTHFPGITITNSGTLAMHGLGNGYVQILINGEKTPNGFTLESLSPDLIERVEILRAGTADIGTQSIAGTINIILKKSVRVDQGEFKAGLVDGGGVTTPSVSLQKSDRSGALSYTFGGSFVEKRINTYENDQEVGTDPSGVTNFLMNSHREIQSRLDVLGFDPRINYTLDGGDTISSETFLSVEHLRREAQTVSDTLLGDDVPYAADDTELGSTNTLLRSDINLVKKLSPDSKLDMKVGVYGSRRDSNFGQQGFMQDGTPDLDDRVISQITEKGFTTTGKYSNTLFDDHTLAIGWEGGDTGRNEDRLENAAAYPGIAAINSDMQFHANIGRLALYGQDEWSATDRLSLYIGLRWEELYTDSEGNDFSEIRNRSSIFFPVFQANWKLSDKKDDQVRLALTRTYNPPLISQLIPRPYTSTNNSAVNPDTEGNPDLRPQLAMGLDTAYEYYWGDGGMFSASAYFRNIQDYISNDVSLVGDRWVETPINVGRAKTHGIELDTKFPLAFSWCSIPGVEINANMTRNWSVVESVPGPDNRVGEQTPWSGAIGFDYRPKDGKFSGGASYRYQSGGPIHVSAEQFENSAPLRQVDVFGLWALDPKTHLRVTLANLLHQKLINEYGYADQTGGIVDVEQRPSPTTVRLALEHKF